MALTHMIILKNKNMLLNESLKSMVDTRSLKVLILENLLLMRLRSDTDTGVRLRMKLYSKKRKTKILQNLV